MVLRWCHDGVMMVMKCVRGRHGGLKHSVLSRADQTGRAGTVLFMLCYLLRNIVVFCRFTLLNSRRAPRSFNDVMRTAHGVEILM